MKIAGRCTLNTLAQTRPPGRDRNRNKDDGQSPLPNSVLFSFDALCSVIFFSFYSILSSPALFSSVLPRPALPRPVLFSSVQFSFLQSNSLQFLPALPCSLLFSSVSSIPSWSLYADTLARTDPGPGFRIPRPLDGSLPPSQLHPVWCDVMCGMT